MQPALHQAMHETAEGDEQIAPVQALRRVRRWLPEIRTVEDLFVATAWQPFKCLLYPRFVSYTVPVVDVWAKARAAGRPAPGR